MFVLAAFILVLKFLKGNMFMLMELFTLARKPTTLMRRNLM